MNSFDSTEYTSADGSSSATTEESKDQSLAFPRPQISKNQVALSKRGVNVFVRFRPDCTEEEKSGHTCITYNPNYKKVSVLHENTSYRFNLKRVFPPESTQEQVFLTAALPLVESILKGYNSAIIGYGQTGSGKTHTLLGPGYDHPHNIGRCPAEMRGIAPRLLQSIFHQIDTQGGIDGIYRVYASYIHIYNEEINDLLDSSKSKLKVFQDKEKGLWVTDATKIPTNSIEEMLRILQRGTRLRVTAATNSNATSSRSHALLVLTITKHVEKNGSYKASQVYITDLCGSERIVKTGAEETRLQEAQSINKSLLALGNVISALAEKKYHVPYRDSKITRLLQNCFGGNSLTCLILCCSSNSANAVETLSTLRFGDRANLVHNKPKVNQKESIDEIKKLLNQANARNFAQEKVIRQQNEKIIQMEIIMNKLYEVIGEKPLKEIQKRLQFKIPEKSKNAFDKLGSSVFAYLVSFLDPCEVINAMGVCKVLSERLKSDTIWKLNLQRLRDGISSISSVHMLAWPRENNLSDTYWNTVKEVLRMNTMRKMPLDPMSQEKGLHLLPRTNE